MCCPGLPCTCTPQLNPRRGGSPCGRRFKSAEQVEVLSRVMRAWDEDGLPLPEGIHVGEFVLKASVCVCRMQDVRVQPALGT